MSVEIFDKGKGVRVKVPKEIAEDSSFVIEECDKKERDEECNWCPVKYTCRMFVESMPILKAVLITNN